MTKTTLTNPYTARGPIKERDSFFGRQAELRDIYIRLLGHQSVCVIGERRVGKSSILSAVHFMRDSFGIPEQLAIASIDAQLMLDWTEAQVIEFLLRAISEATGASVTDTARHGLWAIAKEVQSRDLQLVISIDEFDALAHNEKLSRTLFPYLRAWTTQFEIPFLIALRDRSVNLSGDEQVGSSFFNVFGSVYVGPFLEHEAYSLIRTPAQRFNIPFVDEEVHRVISLAGFLPLFLQMACYHLFNIKLTGKVPVALGDELGRRFSLEAKPFFDYMWRVLPERQRAALLSFVEHGDASDSNAERELMRKGILIQQPTDTRARIFSTVFSDLVRENVRAEAIRAAKPLSSPIQTDTHSAAEKVDENIASRSADAHRAKPIRVFFSYSHEDRKMRARLDKALATLKNTGRIESWFDGEIQAGKEWNSEIATHLKLASIILLLVSDNFLSSRFCYKVELEEALRRHRDGTARVVPIILRECDWKDGKLDSLQALPAGGKPIMNWARRDQAWADVARGIRQVVSSLTGNG